MSETPSSDAICFFGVSVFDAQKPLLKALPSATGDTDVTGDARNPEAGRSTTTILNSGRKNETSAGGTSGGRTLKKQ